MIDRMRQVVLRDRQHLMLDFSECQSVSADAGIMLAAEAERCRQMRTRRDRSTLVGNYPTSASVEQFLQYIGFFKLLRIVERRENEADDDSESFIRVRSGVRDRSKVIADVAEMAWGGIVQMDAAARRSLIRGLIEAMNNVTKHAYPPEWQSDVPQLHGRWWIAGYWNRKERRLLAYIYDQGIGIPATIPIKHRGILSAIQSALGLGESDADMIVAAMKIGTSSSEEAHRGKGMPDLKRLVERAATGHLRILSGAGEYLYTRETGEVVTEHGSSLGGTLIEWEISDQSLIRWSDHDA